MKQNKLCLAIIFLVSVNFSFGQKTEINFNAYSGLFSFRGNGTATNSSIGCSQFDPIWRTSNPYGQKSGFSYEFELQLQRVSKKHLIYGCGIGFETLQSKVHIDTSIFSAFIVNISPANGTTFLKNTFITVNPYIGHRFSFPKSSFDVLAGIDMGYCLKSSELIWSPSGTKVNPDEQNDLTKPTIDFRARIQIKTQIKKFGFLAGYSLGVTNYQSQNNLKAYTSFIRLGLSYQIK